MKANKHKCLMAVFCLGFALLAHAEKVLDIKHWQTQNGVPVYFVAADQIPMVDVRVVFDAGSARDDQRFGLASMTSALLDEGAKGLTADEIAKQFDNVGAVYNASAGRDMAFLGFRSLSDEKYFNPALQTFINVLTQPSFPKKAFFRVQKQMIAGLQQQQQQPSTVAKLTFYKTIYGDQPYGHLPSGTLKTVKALTVYGVKQFYRRYYVAQNAMIVMVGALSDAQAKHIANQMALSLPAGQKPAALPVAKPLTQPVVNKIQFPSQQTHILFGQVGVNLHSPAYFPLYVGNDVLGGSAFTSRLFDDVREKRGLAYVAASSINPMRENGPIAVILQTRNDKASEALAVATETIKNFVAKGPTAKELKLVKQNIIGGFPLRFASNSAILDKLSVLGFYHLPINYWDTYRGRIKKTSAKQIQQAFAAHFMPNTLATILVGRYSG